jgi:hypothetical protein
MVNTLRHKAKTIRPSFKPSGYSVPSSLVGACSSFLPVLEVAVACRARASLFSVSMSVCSPTAETLPSSDTLVLLGARVAASHPGTGAERPGLVSMVVEVPGVCVKVIVGIESLSSKGEAR